MKRLIIFIVLSFSIIPVYAEDFTSKEDYYYKLCLSSTLSSTQKQTCKEFNQYLLNRNDKIKKDIETTSNTIQQIQLSIKETKQTLSKLTTQINKQYQYINYINKEIEQTEKNRTNKENELKNRLYSLQSFYNTSSISYYIIPHSLKETLSLMSHYHDINDYEQELIKEIEDYEKDLTKKKKELQDSIDLLEKEKNHARQIQNHYVELLYSKKESLRKSEEKEKDYIKLQLLFNNATTTSSYKLDFGNSKKGNEIAKVAIKQIGKRYYWGKQGPHYFDCSGLVYYCHKKSHISISRSTASSYSHQGQSVTRSNLTVGDVITFSYGSSVDHIGIYIGNNQFCHAVGLGSQTRGQSSKYCVKVSSLDGYWSQYIFNYRRLY